MKKVSIISPCYNGASYLPHFLQSLSEQTYTNIEFIFVNDGSTDNSEQLFLDYKPRLEQKGWSVIYIKQENAGQAAALNKGLEIFSVDYLLWPDSDDILLPQHIEQKVSFMEAHPEYALAFCQLEEVAENDLDKPLRIIERIPEKEDNLFSDLIHNRNILWPPIGAIIRSSAFLDVLPQRKIYEGKGGQNFQILLPLASKYQAGYIKEVLGKYVVRETSHSRVQNDFIRRQNDLLDIWTHTILKLSTLNDSDKLRNLFDAYDYYEQIKRAATAKPASTTQTIWIFGCIPLFTIKKRKNTTKIKLLKFIPFIKIH